jgi:uncharacterized OsmC-like protein
MEELTVVAGLGSCEADLAGSVADARRAHDFIQVAITVEPHRMEADAKKRISDLQGMLERNPDEARQVLQPRLMTDGTQAAEASSGGPPGGLQS